MLNIIIPMAGRGSRFADAGYTVPKPLIEINSRPMIQLVMENLSAGINRNYRFIFIVQSEHMKNKQIKKCLLSKDDNKIIEIDYITEGPADSVSLAMDIIGDNEEILIANSDQYVDISMEEFHSFCSEKEKHGVIMTFMTDGDPKWSYVRKNDDGLVVETKEKVAISNEATVGIYYFKRAKDFHDSLINARKKNERTNNEFYVCPLYNYLAALNCKIYTYEIKQHLMWGLGTPVDLNKYLEKIHGS